MVLPPLRTVAQLKLEPTGPSDCALVACISIGKAASQDRLDIVGRTRREELVLRMRQAANNSGPTNLAEAQTGFTSPFMAAQFRDVGLQAPPFRIVGDWETFLKEGLDRDGRVVYFHAWYRTLVDAYPKLAGQLVDVNFNHAHAGQGLFIKTKNGVHRRVHWTEQCPNGHRARKEGETLYVRVAEGLQDGRRPEIAKGPQFWPLDILRAATEDNLWTDSDGRMHRYGAGRIASAIIPTAKEA